MQRLITALVAVAISLLVGCAHDRSAKRGLSVQAIRQMIPVEISCPDESETNPIGDADDRYGRRLRYQTQNGLDRPLYCKVMIIIITP